MKKWLGCFFLLWMVGPTALAESVTQENPPVWVAVLLLGGGFLVGFSLSRKKNKTRKRK